MYVDIGYILDSSGSLSAHYDTEKMFLKELAESFGVNTDSRAGVVTFSSHAELSIKLNDHFDLASFNRAVDEIPLMDLGTRIDRSLKVAHKQLFSTSNGARQGIPKILFLLTDGSQSKENDSEDPAKIADEMRSEGIRIIAIGIGINVDQNALEDIAGGKSDTFSAKSFNELISKEFIKRVVNKKCDLGK